MHRLSILLDCDDLLCMDDDVISVQERHADGPNRGEIKAGSEAGGLGRFLLHFEEAFRQNPCFESIAIIGGLNRTPLTSPLTTPHH